MNKNLIKAIASFGFIGYFPLFAGTVGSLIGILIYLFLKDNPIFYLTTTIILLILGFWVSSKAKEVFGKKDPNKIIIDEVAGMLISLFYLPFTPIVILFNFLIYRAFDMIKPPPIDSLEKLSGGRGIMLDDIVAGVYTNLCFQIALRLASLKIS